MNIRKYVQKPQENVFIGASRKPISYDEWNPQQFILGHLITAMACDKVTEKDMMCHKIKLIMDHSSHRVAQMPPCYKN